MIESWNRVVNAAAAIAEKLAGKAPEASGNRLADSLETIAENIGSGGSGGGGSGGGEGPLLVNIVYEDPSTQTKGPLRGDGSSGLWLDTNSTTIFNALLSRGVVVHEYISADDENPALDSYVPISSWYKVESEGMFGFSVDGSTYEGSDTGYPAKVGV